MIYPKNEQIESLLASAVDEETGEMLISEDELAEKIASIEMEFDEKVKALRNSYLADVLDAKCVEAEASALWKAQQETSKRAKAIQNRAERTKRFIAYLLQGEKFDKDGVRITQTTRTEIVVEDGFVDWARVYAPRLLNEPTVRKADLNSAVKAGQHFDFVHQEERKDIRIK